MKKIFIIFTILLCSSLIAQVKIWKQTTTADFSSGTFNRVISTTISDGELQLIHPLVQIGKDTLDSSIPRFVSYDDAGNYLQGWVSLKKVYVQKFNHQRQPISPVINVDENARASDWMIGVALLNDGHFAVGWVESFDSTNGFSYTPRYCQFFDASNAKINKNMRFFNLSNGTGSIPRPIADQINQRFLIIGTEKKSTNVFYSYAWLYNSSGVKLRDSIKIVPSGVLTNENQINGAYHNGKFAFVISSTDANVALFDMYFMLADSNCIPLTEPTKANDNSSKGIFPFVAFDEAGNCFAVWKQDANSSGKLYGQSFDFLGRKIGTLTQLTDIQSGNFYWQNISWVNGMFRIAYQKNFSNGQPSQQWASYWKILSITSGNFISGIFDAGNQQTNYQQISWNGNTPPGTNLKLQLRSSVAKEDIQSASWIGPLSASDYYTNASGENINAATNVKRFLQMKAFFETDTNGMTPILNDVSISYMSTDTIAPVPVSNVTLQTEHRRIVIGWIKSSSVDVRSYRIYRTIGLKNFEPESFVTIPAHSISYIDSSVSFDITYRYGITVVDSTFNESALIQTGQVFPKTMKIFVSPSGSTSGDGTSSRPFLKIKEGFDFSFRGDTIIVMTGEYAEDIVMKEGISLIGSGASATKLINTGGASTFTTASNSIVKGFTFEGRGINCVGKNIIVTENIITGNGSGLGIGVGDSMNIVISKNLISNFFVGLQTRAAAVIIRNNIISSQICIQMWGKKADIVNNTFIVRSGLAGVQFTMGSGTLRNNCFAGYPPSGTYITSIQVQPTASVERTYNNRWGFNHVSEISLGATEISVDPLFVNVAKNNFHLGSGSFCINAGNPLPEDNDKDGSRNNIGAHGGPDPLPDYMTFALATELSLKGGTGFPDDTVAVDIILSNAVGLKKADIEILFDENAATFINVTNTSLTNGFVNTIHDVQTGKRFILLEGTSEIISGSGTIATLRFKLNPSLSGGEQSAVEIGGAEILDGGNNPIVLSSVASGVIVIKSPQSFPHRIFVDGSFSGISDGTIFNPYLTIQQGVSSAKEGDTVFVAAGMYKGPISMKSNVYVRGSGAAVTTITCPNDPLISIPTVIRFNNVQHTGIYGCALINESMGNVVEVMSSDIDIAMNKIDQSGMGINSVNISSGSHVTIRDNYFIESKYGGFNMISLGSDNTIISGNIFSPSSTKDMIVLSANASATIMNNEFHLSKDLMTGITGLKSKRSTVANNLFVGSVTAGIGIKLIDAESTYVLNNIFDMQRAGIDENNGSQYILNNVFLGSTVGVNVSQSTVHLYNLFWNNSIDVNNRNLDATEISADPQFINQVKGDYHPSLMSVMHNGGDPSVQWNDKDGTRNDIGIYGGPYADATMFVSANIRLRIASVYGSHGDTIKIPIVASGVLGMSGLRLMIEFDSQRLQLLNIHTTTTTKSFSMVRKNIGQSIISVELSGSESVTIDSAAVVELTMIVQPQATGSAFVNFQNVYVMSGAAQMISVQNIENGIVDLTPLFVESKKVSLPEVFLLEQNYPNPFNPFTVISYQLPMNNQISIKVYDVIGREVAMLVDEVKETGYYSVRFDASKLSSGIYFYKLISGKFSEVKKMILIK